MKSAFTFRIVLFHLGCVTSLALPAAHNQDEQFCVKGLYFVIYCFITPLYTTYTPLYTTYTPLYTTYTPLYTTYTPLYTTYTPTLPSRVINPFTFSLSHELRNCTCPHHCLWNHAHRWSYQTPHTASMVATRGLITVKCQLSYCRLSQQPAPI